MKCPNCNETLMMTERHNVEIDYCPSCRGVWLDKGELDKMLEYAERKSADPAFDRPYTQDYNEKDKPYYKHGKPHKKRSFLGDLFDFD